MNRLHHHLTEPEVTAWVLIAIFVAILLLFTWLLWRKLSPDVLEASPPQGVVQVAVCSDPRLVVMRPPGDVAGQVLRRPE